MADELGRIDRISMVEASIEDAKSIQAKLRFFDQRECLIQGFSPDRALTDPFFVKGARNFAIKIDDEVIAICGTVPITSKTARVWMLGTEGIDKNWRLFLKGSKPAVDLLQGHYDSVENFVPIDHIRTIMWLQWCGFTFDEELYDVCNHTMIRFVRCKKDKNNVYYLTKRPVMH